MSLVATSLVKSYGANKALSDVDFEVLPGQVHGLVGANGAGKSTLIKILSGAIAPDSGTITVDGWSDNVLDPRTAQQLGIACIYQDPGLAGTLDLMENVLLGHERTRLGGLLATGPQREEVVRVLAEVGLRRSLTTTADKLPPADQQLLQIAKVLYRRSRFVIMDEPTAALGETERQQLFTVVRKLKASGVGVVYISHHLDEVLDLCDVVTVMRGGQTVVHAPVNELDVKTMVRAMIGHDITALVSGGSDLGSVALEMRAVTQDNGLADISLRLHEGEVLGVTGLVGSGRSRLARLLFGIEAFQGGDMDLLGAPYKPKSPKDAIKRGVGLVPEDRKQDALLMGLSASKNITLAKLPKRFAGILNLRRETAIARGWIERLSVHPPSPNARPQGLSGGNQQKLVIARWVHAGSKLLILDEPTQGVDVGARDQILGAIRDLASAGAAILLISQDVEELQQIADRVLVMRRGRIVGELDRTHISDAAIIPLAMGAASQPASPMEALA